MRVENGSKPKRKEKANKNNHDFNTIKSGSKTSVQPEIGGYIVAAWLTLIALTLLIGFDYVDVAVRDLVMAIAALSMAKLSKFTAE